MTNTKKKIMAKSHSFLFRSLRPEEVVANTVLPKGTKVAPLSTYIQKDVGCYFMSWTKNLTDVAIGDYGSRDGYIAITKLEYFVGNEHFDVEAMGVEGLKAHDELFRKSSGLKPAKDTHYKISHNYAKADCMFVTSEKPENFVIVSIAEIKGFICEYVSHYFRLKKEILLYSEAIAYFKQWFCGTELDAEVTIFDAVGEHFLNGAYQF